LQSEGSSELGLYENDALEFIDLLEKYEVPILGYEVWRCIDGSYFLDIASIWYSESEPHKDYRSARSVLRAIGVRGDDVITIQFGELGAVSAN
jgi:hypothetical protein